MVIVRWEGESGRGRSISSPVLPLGTLGGDGGHPVIGTVVLLSNLNILQGLKAYAVFCRSG